MNKALFLCAALLGGLAIVPTKHANAQFYTPYVTRKEIGSTIAAQPSTAEGLVASGTTMDTAFQLSASENTVTDSTSGTAVKLKDVPVGSTVIVYNRSTNAISIFPTSATDQIESYGAGVAFSLTAGGTVEFHRMSTTQWRIKP